MIGLSGVTFGWGAETLVADLTLTVPTGTLTALVGPSGSGKSTLLRLVAGLLAPRAGTVTRPPGDPARAAMSLVFQDPRLLPWLTVEENVAFALEAAGVPKGEWAGRIAPLLARVGLSAAAKQRPGALSGGMAQRAALVRGLALRPRCLLLDEPFAAVDPLLREDLQDALQELLAGADTTALLVTHDIAEALVLADRVLVLGGRPVHVTADVAIDAPRPRGEAWRLSEGFRLAQARVRGALAARLRDAS